MSHGTWLTLSEVNVLLNENRQSVMIQIPGGSEYSSMEIEAERLEVQRLDERVWHV